MFEREVGAGSSRILQAMVKSTDFYSKCSRGTTGGFYVWGKMELKFLKNPFGFCYGVDGGWWKEEQEESS